MHARNTTLEAHRLGLGLLMFSSEAQHLFIPPTDAGHWPSFRHTRYYHITVMSTVFYSVYSIGRLVDADIRCYLEFLALPSFLSVFPGQGGEGLVRTKLSDGLERWVAMEDKTLPVLVGGWRWFWSLIAFTMFEKYLSCTLDWVWAPSSYQ